jgi:putative sigma-54 modulation protein
MKVTLSVRHGDVPDPLRSHTEDGIAGLSKYFDKLVEADIVLDQENHRHIAEVRLHTSNDTHFARTEAADWRTAIDGTITKLRRQLKRHKSKLNRRSLTRVEREQIFQGQIEEDVADDPSVAPVDWDRISSREAIARLETSGEEVLVFVDAQDGVVKIARRDGEGSVSVVEAEAFEVEEH